MNYLEYYYLESYLYEQVHQKFHTEHSLGAFDLFSIVIWKAEQEKADVARQLLAVDPEGRRDLEVICRALTASVYEAPEHKERLRLLVNDWQIPLSIASAILSVGWPEEFTVYDRRFQKRLWFFQDLEGLTDFEEVWKGYSMYNQIIYTLPPEEMSLRDCDRYIFGETTALGLKRDIQQLFQDESESEG